MITQEQILQNILKIRTNKGFTQQNVAEHLGIEQGSYSLIEKGRRELSIERLLQIAIFLGVDVKDIITYPNTEYNNSDDEVKAVLQIELKKDKKEPKCQDLALSGYGFRASIGDLACTRVGLSATRIQKKGSPL